MPRPNRTRQICICSVRQKADTKITHMCREPSREHSPKFQQDIHSVPDLENGTRREQSKERNGHTRGQNSDWKSNTSEELIVCPGPHTTHMIIPAPRQGNIKLTRAAISPSCNPQFTRYPGRRIPKEDTKTRYYDAMIAVLIYRPRDLLTGSDVSTGLICE